MHTCPPAAPAPPCAAPAAFSRPPPGWRAPPPSHSADAHSTAMMWLEGDEEETSVWTLALTTRWVFCLGDHRCVRKLWCIKNNKKSNLHSLQVQMNRENQGWPHPASLNGLQFIWLGLMGNQEKEEREDRGGHLFITQDTTWVRNPSVS